jgi:hypothetical protein
MIKHLFPFSFGEEGGKGVVFVTDCDTITEIRRVYIQRRRKD